MISHSKLLCLEKKMEEKNMNNKNKMSGLSMLLALSSVVMIASGVQAEANASTVDAYANIGAGIALGLAGIGTGLSQGPIGAAAVGMIAEDSSKFVNGLIFTALPETIVLFGFLALFLL
ncbi:F0F1 ATP synthase subunit C [Euryarchaeota archaeon]|nr:F0F1 ATP synthase subunit C [Euryarchaeota archaeon]MDC0623558.1 F0F1 ATP synthase subunit C [Euryarchaeota archaeon]